VTAPSPARASAVYIGILFSLVENSCPGWFMNIESPWQEVPDPLITTIHRDHFLTLKTHQAPYALSIRSPSFKAAQGPCADSWKISSS
jgi:hypothetical protein